MVQVLGPWTVAAVAAYTGVKVGLNGTRERLKGVSKVLEEHTQDEHIWQMRIAEQLGGVEANINMLVREMNRQKDRDG